MRGFTPGCRTTRRTGRRYRGRTTLGASTSLRWSTEPFLGSQEGYRILWYHSSQKQQRDCQARMKKVNKARQRLQLLRPPGRGQAFQTEQAAREAAQRVLDKEQVQDWLQVVIEEVVQSEQVQVGPG